MLNQILVILSTKNYVLGDKVKNSELDLNCTKTVNFCDFCQFLPVFGYIKNFINLLVSKELFLDICMTSGLEIIKMGQIGIL